MSDLSFTNPLTEEHFQQLKAGLEAMKVAKTQIDAAKRAGIDVSTQETAMNETKQKLERIKAVYFPNRN